MTQVPHHAPDGASPCLRLALPRQGVPFDARLANRVRQAQGSGDVPAPALRGRDPTPGTEGGRLGLARWPGLLRVPACSEARPEAMAAVRAGALGESPFTRAERPQPPEGSPL